MTVFITESRHDLTLDVKGANKYSANKYSVTMTMTMTVTVTVTVRTLILLRRARSSSAAAQRLCLLSEVVMNMPPAITPWSKTDTPDSGSVQNSTIQRVDESEHPRIPRSRSRSRSRYIYFSNAS